MPTEPIPTMPGFHSGFFVAHDQDDTAPTEGLSIIERDRNGLPCFACFFELLFEAMPAEALAVPPVDTSELTPDVTAYVVRFGATLGYLADALGWIMARAMTSPETTVPVFVGRLTEALEHARAALAEAGQEPVI